MNIETYFKEGYVLSPYYNSDDVNNFEKIKTIELKEEQIRSIIVESSQNRQILLKADDVLILVKYTQNYIIKPLDLVEKFENVLENEEDIYDEITNWINFVNIRNDSGFVFVPHFDDKYFDKDTLGSSDFLFKKDEHIVSYILRLILNELNEDTIKQDLAKYINFIKEIKNDAKDKSPDTIFLMLNSIAYEQYKGKSLGYDCIQFYHDNLITNANKAHPLSMRMIGYDYYEGTNGFECDPNKSCYWLEKYFDVTGDPDVARTLGYIYYYGRTTNGVPQGDKAFQYFAIGHIAGGYYEATYKLADCYLKGLGTIPSKQAAFRLVKDIYEPTLNCFLNGEDSKFADVCLRMGSFYKDGIYVDKNLFEARCYYLEARVAIKKRLEHMEYIGDRGVALAISKSLKEVQSELDKKERIVKNNGYVLPSISTGYEDKKFEFSLKDDYIHLVIKNKKNNDEKCIFNHAWDIGFLERSEKIEYLIHSINDESKEFIESINENKILRVGLFNDTLYVTLDMGKGDHFPAFTTFDEVIFVPQTIKDISKKYTIVSVEFYEGSKLYDYLCLKENVNVGDKLTIKSNGEEKIVTVKDIEYVYEDELPLPYEKMTKIK